MSRSFITLNVFDANGEMVTTELSELFTPETPRELERLLDGDDWAAIVADRESSIQLEATMVETKPGEDICLCTVCNGMLKGGDDIVDYFNYKFGELDSIDLAHKNCAPDW